MSTSETQKPKGVMPEPLDTDITRRQSLRKIGEIAGGTVLIALGVGLFLADNQDESARKRAINQQIASTLGPLPSTTDVQQAQDDEMRSLDAVQSGGISPFTDSRQKQIDQILLHNAQDDVYRKDLEKKSDIKPSGIKKVISTGAVLGGFIIGLKKLYEQGGDKTQQLTPPASYRDNLFGSKP